MKTSEWEYEDEYRYLGTDEYIEMENPHVYFFDRFAHFANNIEMLNLKADYEMKLPEDRQKKKENNKNKIETIKNLLRNESIHFYKISHNDLDKLNDMENKKYRICSILHLNDLSVG